VYRAIVSPFEMPLVAVMVSRYAPPPAGVRLTLPAPAPDCVAVTAS
jgi:hypothetical protein